MNQNVKRYLISSAVTFLTGFCIAVAPMIDGITLEGIKTGALTGLAFAGIRAGLKAVIELIISFSSKK
jgi:hypothetical protein